MNRKARDLEPKWLMPVAEFATGAADSVAIDLDKMHELIPEWERELQRAFQDAHNMGFYINEYTTTVHALGDKLLEGMQRIVNKITAEEAASCTDATTRQRNTARTHAILKN